VLISSYHGGMFDHNTRRVLTSFRIVFITFDLFFRHVSSDSSKGATVMITRVFFLSAIIKRVLFLPAILLTLFRSQVITLRNP
jgi:hypothetical protein